MHTNQWHISRRGQSATELVPNALTLTSNLQEKTEYKLPCVYFIWISNISIDKAPANSNNLLDDILNRDNQGYQLEYNFMINDIIQY